MQVGRYRSLQRQRQLVDMGGTSQNENHSGLQCNTRRAVGHALKMYAKDPAYGVMVTRLNLTRQNSGAVPGPWTVERGTLPSFPCLSASHQHRLPRGTTLCIFTHPGEDTEIRPRWARHECASRASAAPAQGIRRSPAIPAWRGHAELIGVRSETFICPRHSVCPCRTRQSLSTGILEPGHECHRCPGHIICFHGHSQCK
jgi:hypothetical protein